MRSVASALVHTWIFPGLDPLTDNFSLHHWVTGSFAQLELREYNGEHELYQGIDDILTGLSIEMIETVFFDSVNRLQRLNDGNGDYVS
jgi:hypothetical protein